MEGRQPEYSHHAGLSSPYTQFSPNHSDPGSSDQASVAGHYQQPHIKYEPDSARPGAYAEYIAQAQSQAPRSYAEGQPRYQPPPQGPAANHAAMAQTNPSIAASSPTYPSHQYSPYTSHEMPQYPGPQGGAMYAPRPDWAGNYGNPQVYGQLPGPPGMGMPPRGAHHLSTVYSFVPIPGSAQHKRPRRRFEEIERMYKCGFQGCEKAYGTLNHLNAHVTMQSHGPKRTPEEFKEIRKEWKAKKKEEDHARKQEEDRLRSEGRPVGHEGTPTSATAQYAPAHMIAPGMGGPQLPPIGYGPAPGQAPPQYTTAPSQADGQAYQSAGQMYTNGGYPQSPYGQQSQMYQQRA